MRTATPSDGGAGTSDETAHLDVLVIGAGLSGIAAGYHLQTRCPGKRYAILEAREAIGGTWDLFRYPGIRSDSDLYTFGFSFAPWRSDRAIADGPSILAYLRETAATHGIDRHIRFGRRVTGARWSSDQGRWTVEIETGPERRPQRLTCGFLYVCAGYYDYDAGYTPDWPGTGRFRGPIVHPQAWPEDLDYRDKRVVVIGSGATAVTLLPAMAETAAHVTMLQRSPTYVVAMPAEDRAAARLRRWLPARAAHALARWKNVLVGLAFYHFARRKPRAAAGYLLAGIRRQLGPDYDLRKHFTPRYDPWDQRLCLVPDGDLFKAIRSGRASVETEAIETFTEHGIRLASGRHLDADLVVTATGLRVKMLGGLRLSVDGRRIDAAKSLLYKGMMVSDVPNLAVAIGYTNASWTLKCELTAAYVCRLLRRMDAKGAAWCVPRRDGNEGESPVIDFTSGYIARARHLLPKQGARRPWRLYQNYLLDLLTLRFGRIEDGAMRFGRSRQVV